MTASTPDRRHHGRRQPGRGDYLAYLVVLPLLIASWMTVLGIRPRAEIVIWHSFFYVAARVLVAWWAAHLGALLAARLLRTIDPPLWLIMVTGFLIVVVPVTLLFQVHAGLLTVLLPDLGERIFHAEFAWSVDYLTHFLSRAVIPFLPVWIGVAHAYRMQFGVDWYPPPVARPVSQPEYSPAQLPDAEAGRSSRPAFLAQSRLPAEAKILTLKAAEHYIEVVSDRGPDLVRYRFNDAVRELADLGVGCQVHRSWWVSWDAIAGIVPCGRTLELRLQDGRCIPVSLTYKHGLLTRFPRRTLGATGRSHPQPG